MNRKQHCKETTKRLALAAAALLLPALAAAQNGVRYYYTHSDGVQYECSVYTDSIVLLSATLGSATEVTVPDSILYGGGMKPVREISANCFSYTDLATVVIPNTVTEIGYGAFSGCDMLTEVTVGTGVRTIWETAFAQCGSLEVLNYNAVAAGVYAFSGSGALDDCDALSTINIGADVTLLPEDLVASIYPLVGLTNVNIAAERLLPLTTGYFGYSVGGVAVTVPCSQLTAYQTDAVWSALGTVTADCSDSTGTGSDSTHTTVYDTVHVTVYDTVHLTVYDTVVRYTDSVYCDTLIVHDTVYIDHTGLAVAESEPVKVYRRDGRLVVEGAAAGESIEFYDMQGRRLLAAVATGQRFEVTPPASGAYLLRVGERPARKVTLP